jgi:RimJ/RimL family protein N-acetyltransferase
VRGVEGKPDPQFFAIVEKGAVPLVDERAEEKGYGPIGVAAYLRIDPPQGSIEVGHINYSPRLQRTIAATEAMYLMMRKAFELGYRRYEWKCHALNAPSRVAAQRLGFSYEGVFRQARVDKGRNRDTAWYAMIDREWPALDRAFTQWLDPANFDRDGRQRTPLSALTGPILVNRG